MFNHRSILDGSLKEAHFIPVSVGLGFQACRMPLATPVDFFARKQVPHSKVHQICDRTDLEEKGFRIFWDANKPFLKLGYKCGRARV